MAYLRTNLPDVRGESRAGEPRHSTGDRVRFDETPGITLGACGLWRTELNDTHGT